MFSYVSAEERIPADHPLRAIRRRVDEVLKAMSKEFDALYAKSGPHSIAPERLLRALLLQLFYSIRSERMLIEQLNKLLGAKPYEHAPSQHNLLLAESGGRCNAATR